MITDSYIVPKHYVTSESGELYVIKLRFSLDSISDVEGLKNHLNYPFSFVNGEHVYFCDLVESVEFEEVNGE